MIVALAAAISGGALMVAAALSHRRAQDRAIEEFLLRGPSALELLEGADGEASGDDARLGVLTERAVGLASQVVERVDRRRSLGVALERAKIPLRPGEFAIILGASTLSMATLLLVLFSSPLLAVVGGVATTAIGVHVVRHRIASRRRAFEAQLPDALSLVASSLSAGHTFLRAIQMMCEEAGPPLAEEFSRVVAETGLGDSLLEALDRMAARLGVRDMEIVVQAIRIQQTIGGRLADLLHTLSDFIRSRDEVRREVKVLTAEGRMSAYVLTGLVPFLFGTMQLLNPGYTTPLFHGWGVAILVYSGTSVLLGMAFILRMVKIDF